MNEFNNQSKEMKQEVSKMTQLLDFTYDKALNGLPMSKDIKELADSYTKKYQNSEVAIKKMVSWQIRKATTSGFVTGLPGLITTPVTLPVNISSVLYIQMRMIAGVAHIRGYDLKDDEVKTMVYMCLAGQSVGDVLKAGGVQVAKKAATSGIKKIPGTVIVKINQAIGFRLITKFGEKGVINLGKLIPFAGGIVGGGFDMTTTRTIAKFATNTFTAFENDNERARIIID